MAYGPPPWRKLIGGIVALVLIIGGALSIIAFARVGSLRGDTYIAYILADQASGIFKGTDVWLQGQKVGVVKEVGFRSLPTDTAVQTVLKMEVMTPFQPFIKKDSRVEFKPGGTYVGAQVVALRIGSPTAAVLEPGDTLTRVSIIDPDLRSNELTAAGQDFPEIVSSLRAIGTRSVENAVTIQHPRRALLRASARDEARLAVRAAHGRGRSRSSCAIATLADRAKLALTRADSLLRITREPGTLNRIKADSGLRVASQRHSRGARQRARAHRARRWLSRSLPRRQRAAERSPGSLQPDPRARSPTSENARSATRLSESR